jgi:filamentous hemagglutinin family protein
MNHHASMNRIYRLVWNQVRSAWIPVAETARGRGKSGRGRSMASANRSALTAAVSLALGSAAHAAPPAPMCLPPTCGTGVTSATSHPVGAQVVSGTASITQSGNTTDVRQSSPDVSIDWLSFNVGSQATVDFIQPSASAVAVNRISGTNGSEILGHLDANGQVYLINPNGIVFGQGAQVNVGGLVASTLDANSSSTPGAQSFAGNGTGSVVNQGTITTANGGYVVLVGNRVSNEGVISARLGTVALGAGSAVTLDFSGNRLVHLQVDQSTLNDLAANSQLIQADGGLVVMTAGAQRTVLASVVNNTGVIEARTVENHDGTIELLGGMTAGTVNVGGTLDASAPAGGNGGFIETNAARVEVADGTKVTTAAPNGLTGSWLIDPSDFTVAPSGGDITGATLSSELAGGNVTILSSSGTVVTNGSGNINVDDTVSWSANTLTLNAYNNININSPMNGSGTASLALLYGQGASNGVINGVAASYNVNAPISLPAGPNFSTQLGSAGTVINYTVVDTMSDLQNINNNLSANYVLGASLDATNVNSWTPLGTDGASHVLNSGNGFSGIFDGLGNTISNLTISLPGSSDVGLFGYSSGMIRNIGLVNVTAYGLGNTGTLVGFNAGSISNSYSSAGFVYGDGYNIDDFDAGPGNFGGLVGVNRGSINNSYTTGYVYGVRNQYPLLPATPVGGLVGLNYGSISKSYSTSTVQGGCWVGGLVGINAGSISESYATGTVGIQVGEATDVGGLVGSNYGPITNSYATGTVVGASQVGGLVGGNNSSVFFMDFSSPTTMISNSYATGSVSGLPNIINGSPPVINTGGLVGNGQAVLTSNSYWNTQTSGQTISEGGSGLTTAQMQSASNFAGWNIATTGGSGDVWRIYTGSTFPLLIDLLTPLTLASSTVTYNGSVQTGPTTTVSGVLGAAATGTNAGSYDGYYSTQQGYDITGGSLTIDPASVTLSGTRVYDGTTIVAGSILSAVGVDGQTFSVTGAGDPSNLSSKNVQTDSALATVTGLTLGSSANGGLASNYALSTTGSSITITPAPITISAVSDSKTYDGTTNASAIPIVGGTIFSGDSLSTLSESFASKNVMGANGSTLNVNSFVISDGNNGNNYSVTVESASGTITPLSSVVWVGGATGNWSTASNWAGGIIPICPMCWL